MSIAAKGKEVYIRVGHRFSKSIGAYGVLGGRSFDCPVDVAWDSNERLYVLNRPEGNVRITVLDFEENYYHEFVRPGTQDGQLTWPSCIAVDADDVLYVSDQHTHRISLFSTEGTFLGKWGTEGSGDGELKEPSGLAFDTNGDLYVVDTGNNRVQKFSKDGRLLLKWGSKGSDDGQFDMPWGIALDQENNVYVADWHNDRIQKFTPEGEFLMAVGSSGSGDGQLQRPAGVAIDRGGDIYVADWGNDRVQVFDPKGTYQLKFTGDAMLSKWALEILLADPAFLRERHRATLEPERRLWHPSSVKVDSHDRIFISDTNRHRLQVYEKETVTVDAEWIDLENPLREIQER